MITKRYQKHLKRLNHRIPNSLHNLNFCQPLFPTQKLRFTHFSKTTSNASIAFQKTLEKNSYPNTNPIFLEISFSQNKIYEHIGRTQKRVDIPIVAFFLFCDSFSLCFYWSPRKISFETTPTENIDITCSTITC